jgi:hypothetical protein
VRRVAPLAVVTDPTMRPAPGRHNSAVLPPDRTGRSDGEPPAVDGQRGAVDVVGVLARQTAAAASSSGAGNLHSPCASEMDDVPVGSRRNHQRDVRTDRAAEHQTRPAVEAMGADGPDRAARPTAARRVGELGGEEFLQETGQRGPATMLVRSSHPPVGPKRANLTGRVAEEAMTCSRSPFPIASRAQLTGGRPLIRRALAAGCVCARSSEAGRSLLRRGRRAAASRVAWSRGRCRAKAPRGRRAQRWRNGDGGATWPS